MEAGLRSGDIYSPWPEEVNRNVTGVLANRHLAPTDAAASALHAENEDEKTIHVTGNTVIDALLFAQRKIAANPSLAPAIAPLRERFAGRRIIAVAAHRRENFGAEMAQIAQALQRLARDDVAIIYPLHPNPNVGGVMRTALAGIDNIALLNPFNYHNFVATMEASDIVLTDSGGIQEEAPSLGKPVLVMRDTTEHPEGLAAGTAKLVGAEASVILAETSRLLNDPAAYQAMARAQNPYGDNLASERIAEIIARSCAGATNSSEMNAMG